MRKIIIGILVAGLLLIPVGCTGGERSVGNAPQHSSAAGEEKEPDAGEEGGGETEHRDETDGEDAFEKNYLNGNMDPMTDAYTASGIRKFLTDRRFELEKCEVLGLNEKEEWDTITEDGNEVQYPTFQIRFQNAGNEEWVLHVNTGHVWASCTNGMDPLTLSETDYTVTYDAESGRYEKKEDVPADLIVVERIDELTVAELSEKQKANGTLLRQEQLLSATPNL